MGLVQVQVWSDWHDGVGVEHGVRREVVRLDVPHVDAVSHPRGLVHVLDVVPQVWVLVDELFVRLEVHHVHLVEPHQSREQPHVRLRQDISRDVPLPTQDLLALVQAPEQFGHRGVVRTLGRREPALVHAVVDAVVHPLVDLVDGGPQLHRVEVQRLVPRDVVKLGVEVADDLAALVAHDRVSLLTPQDGHGEPGALGGAVHRPVVQVSNEDASEKIVGSARVTGPPGERADTGRPGD